MDKRDSCSKVVAFKGLTLALLQLCHVLKMERILQGQGDVVHLKHTHPHFYTTQDLIIPCLGDPQNTSRGCMGLSWCQISQGRTVLSGLRTKEHGIEYESWMCRPECPHKYVRGSSCRGAEPKLGKGRGVGLLAGSLWLYIFCD